MPDTHTAQNFEDRLKTLEKRIDQYEALLGYNLPSEASLKTLKIPSTKSYQNLKTFQEFLSNKLYLFFIATEISTFALMKLDTKTASDKFYNHINKIITSVPAIGTVLKGLETGEVAASISDEATNEYVSPLPLNIPHGFALPYHIETSSIELKRRLQARHIATELTLQYQNQLRLVDSSGITSIALYATYAIVRYLTYYIRRKAKNKQVYDLSISNITDAVAAHRLDNPFAEREIHLKPSNLNYKWHIGELFACSGLYNGKLSYSCDPNEYSKHNHNNPHSLAIIYGYRQLNKQHTARFKKKTKQLAWHKDEKPLNLLPKEKINLLIAPLIIKSFSQDTITTLTPSKRKISKGLVKLMSFILLICSVALILLGIAAIKDGNFLSGVFSSVTNALGLNALSGSLTLAAGLSLILLLSVTYLCLWFEDESSPIHSDYDLETNPSTKKSNNSLRSEKNEYRAVLTSSSEIQPPLPKALDKDLFKIQAGRKHYGPTQVLM